MYRSLHLDEDFNLIEKIKSKKANVQDYVWLLNDVSVVNLKNGNLKKDQTQELKIKSIYNYEKINNLFKNFDTMSFLDLIFNYNELIDNGYSKSFS